MQKIMIPSNYHVVADYKDILNGTLGATTGTRDVVALKSDGKWDPAVRTTASDAKGLLGITLKSGNDTDLVPIALKAVLANSSWSFTRGAPQFLHSVAGDFTATEPSGSGDYVRVVGWALNLTTLLFDGLQSWREVP